ARTMSSTSLSQRNHFARGWNELCDRHVPNFSPPASRAFFPTAWLQHGTQLSTMRALKPQHMVHGTVMLTTPGGIKRRAARSQARARDRLKRWRATVSSAGAQALGRLGRRGLGCDRQQDREGGAAADRGVDRDRAV